MSIMGEAGQAKESKGDSRGRGLLAEQVVCHPLHGPCLVCRGWGESDPPGSRNVAPGARAGAAGWVMLLQGR